MTELEKRAPEQKHDTYVESVKRYASHKTVHTQRMRCQVKKERMR